MTTVPNTVFRLPDPPEKDPEDMTNARHLAETGNMHHLKLHLGNPETTIVKSELFLANDRRGPDEEYRIPDLLVAFDADPELYDRNNGYVVSEQGKPPDFVLEVASPGTRAADNAVKRDFYARHGVGEYWRFDEQDAPGSVKLAGDRLVDGRYEPLPVMELADGVVQGYSAALKLHLRWERGGLRWHDPETGEQIATFESERDRADRERDGRIAERDARIAATDRADAEHQARLAAEARVRELERILSRRDS